MIPLLALLAASPAVAAPPSLACTPLEVEIPDEIEEYRKSRPKGFQWEGFFALSVLEDGRMLLGRHATLEDLSRRQREKQNEKEITDRVTQLFLLDAKGELESVITIPRGSILETLALPGGGVAVARTYRAITVVDYIDPKGEWLGTVKMPENPQADKRWREHNPLDGTGPARLTASDQDRVVSWHAGEALALDLPMSSYSVAKSLYPLGIFTLRGRSDRASELLLVDRNRRVTWLDADLNVLRTRDCNACRVVGMDKAVSLDKAEGSWLPAMRQRGAAVAERFEGGIEVRFAGLSSREREPAPVRLPVEIDSAWTWRMREGPWGTVLVAVSERGGDTHTVRAIQSGEEDPVWTWTAPKDLVREDEDIVADALGPYVRIRVVEGQGLEEDTRLSMLVDPRDGTASDFVEPSALQPPLREAMESPWVSRHFAGDLLLRNTSDAFSTRIQPGPTTARLETCRIRLKP